MHHLKGQHVLILGLGASGLAMVKWCLGQGSLVSVADTRIDPPNLVVLKKDYPQVKFIGGPFTSEHLQIKAPIETEEGNAHIRAVFKSPGLTPEEVAPVWNAAKEMGLWVGSELSLFAKALSELKAEMGYVPNVLAVTGTNGKTTVTSLTAQMLSRGGLRTVVAGNIGPTLLDTLAEKLAEIKDIPPEEDEEEMAFEGKPIAMQGPTHSDNADALGTDTAQEQEQEQEHQQKQESSEFLNENSSDLPTGEVDAKNDSLNFKTLNETESHAIEEDQFAAQDQSQIEENPRVQSSAFEQISSHQHAEVKLNAGDESELSLLPLAVQELNPEHKKYKKHRGILPQAWVLELSSFQLNDSDDFDPTAAVILNITEDHLDWHSDMHSYVNAKAKIFGPHTHQILCRDDAQVLALRPTQLDAKALKKAKAEALSNELEWIDREVITYGSDLPSEPGHYGLETVNGMTWLVKAIDPNDDEGEVKSRRRKTPVSVDELIMQRLMPADALRIRGSHNALNALAALALCSTAKATSLGHGPMLYALREYKGEPHRVEPVMRINDVEYFDDSKGTNVGATLAAIKGLGSEHPLIVILGGEGKGQDFTPLAQPLSKHAKLVILIGRDAPIIKAALDQAEIKIINALSLEEAVQVARGHAQSGDAVLMSPACASFDMFKNYEHRAEVFVKTVRELALEEGVV